MQRIEIDIYLIYTSTTEKYFVINLSYVMNMLVYNQKYRILLSASLAGVMIEHIGQQTIDRLWFESMELDKLFLLAFETNGRNFESTVIFF